MIRRATEDDGWLLISQVDHAHLAADLARVWGNEAVPALPLPVQLERAIRRHDDGWYDWEAAPGVTPASGRPRDFTEMPMPEAAAIWSRSIAIAGRADGLRPMAVRRFHATLGGEPPSPAQFAVLEAVLDRPSRYSAAEIEEAASEPADVVEGTLAHLQRAGVVVRHEPSPLAGDRLFETRTPFTPNPLEGTWVSRHFARLADEAVKNRDDPADVAAAKRFLAEQEAQRTAWRPAIEAFASDDTVRLIDAGYRLLRFFDWLSLWLCCAERTEPADMPTPGGPTIRFAPTGPNHYHVTPWPLAVERLELAVTAFRVPNRTFADAAELERVLDQTEPVRLTMILASGESSESANDGPA